MMMAGSFYFLKSLALFLLLSNDVGDALEPKNQELAKILGTFLDIRMSSISGYAAISSGYEQRMHGRDFSIQPVDGMKMAKKFARSLEKLMKKRKEAVMRLVDAAENTAQNFNWSQKISDDFYYNNVEYINTTEVDDDGEDDYAGYRRNVTLKRSERYKRDVNLNTSFVQVPFDIYCKVPKLLQSIAWSKTLDDEFKRNSEADPSLTFQYFGSVQGYTRVYPGYKWMLIRDKQPNVYDCRNTMWYTQSATFPKDVVILLDVSGSMMGLRMIIARQAVRAILAMLSDNDFFNVLTFNNDTQALEPCFNGTLVQADYSNKQAILDRLEDTKTTKVADFQLALDKTLNLMTGFHGDEIMAGCNCAIMLITDGAPNNFQDVFDQAKNNTDVQVRVFTYLIGKDKSYAKGLRDMACKNNGFFAQVESSSGVSEQVLHHVEVLNRPLAFAGDHHVIWTKAYFDRTVDYDSLESEDRICSVASPVYGNFPNSYPKLLGVMGTDVTIRDMLRTIAIESIGVNSHVFLVNNNGHVIIHPLLTSTYNNKIHPRYNSIDIEYLEITTVQKRLRNKLVQQKSGIIHSAVTTTPLTSWDGVQMVNLSYYLIPVRGTPFGLGLALPTGYGHTRVNYSQELSQRLYNPQLTEEYCNKAQKDVMNESIEVSIGRLAAICSLNLSRINLTASWQYCTARKAEEDNATMEQIDKIKMFLMDTRNPKYVCNEELLNSLLFDAYVTAPLDTLWSELRTESSNWCGIEMTFVATKSGMLRYYWQEDLSGLYQEARKQLFQFSRMGFPEFYRRAAALPDEKWLYMLTDEASTEEEQRRSVLVAKAIRIQESVMGVVGVLLSYEKFVTIVKNYSSSNICTWNKKPNGSNFCYIIDDNGIVMISEDKTLVGTNFGLKQGYVMNKLVSTGVFQRVQMINYTSMCLVKINNDKSAASTSKYYFAPFYSVWSYGLWWSKELAKLLFNLILSHWFTIIFTTPSAHASPRSSDAYKACQQKFEMVKVNFSALPYSGFPMCNDTQCAENFGIYEIDLSNLLLVVVPQPIDREELSVKCSCMRDKEKVFKLAREEQTFDKPCKRIHNSKERRQLGKCVQWKEEVSRNLPCSASAAKKKTELFLWNGNENLNRTYRFCSIAIFTLLIFSTSRMIT